MTRCCPFPRSPAREGLPIVVPKRQCFVDPPSPRHEPSTPERLHRASRCLTSASSRSISRAALATAASVDPLEERRRGARVRRHQTVQHLAQQRPEHGRRLIGGWPGFVFVVAVAVGAHRALLCAPQTIRSLRRDDERGIYPNCSVNCTGSRRARTYSDQALGTIAVKSS